MRRNKPLYEAPEIVQVVCRTVVAREQGPAWKKARTALRETAPLQNSAPERKTRGRPSSLCRDCRGREGCVRHNIPSLSHRAAEAWLILATLGAGTDASHRASGIIF